MHISTGHVERYKLTDKAVQFKLILLLVRLINKTMEVKLINDNIGSDLTCAEKMYELCLEIIVC